MDKRDLMEKTVKELKLIAKRMQLHRYSALRKENLITYILTDKQSPHLKSPQRKSPRCQQSPRCQRQLSAEFPMLYNRQSNDKWRQWRVRVVADEVITEYGQVGGKLAMATVMVKGKNVGKVNETSAHQQAINTAQSKWNKKVDEEYVEQMFNVALVSKRDAQKILPMLALQYEKRGRDIKFPCYVQPKIDGVRALYYNDELWSRLGNQFTHLDHILREIRLLVSPDLHLDGELYTTAYSFEQLVGLVKKKKLTAKDVKDLGMVKYIVYDFVSDLDYDKRYKTLKRIFARESGNIMLLQTEICQSPDDIPTFLSKYIAEGYEGLIIRNLKGPYKVKYRFQNYTVNGIPRFPITNKTRPHITLKILSNPTRIRFF
jgi:DNA ligase 1